MARDPSAAFEKILRTLYYAGTQGHDQAEAVAKAKADIYQLIVRELKPLQWSGKMNERFKFIRRRRDYLRALVQSGDESNSFDAFEVSALTWALSVLSKARRMNRALRTLLGQPLDADEARVESAALAASGDIEGLSDAGHDIDALDEQSQ